MRQKIERVKWRVEIESGEKTDEMKLGDIFHYFAVLGTLSNSSETNFENADNCFAVRSTPKK